MEGRWIDRVQLCKALPPTWTPSVFHDQQRMHAKLYMMPSAHFITVHQFIKKVFHLQCKQQKFQSFDWSSGWHLAEDFSGWSCSNGASVPTSKRSHEQGCKMRKARHHVINTVRKGGPTVHSHHSSSPETSNKTSLLSAPPRREGSQRNLFPSSSSELPSLTQSLLETSF